jgi:hypothetical protein
MAGGLAISGSIATGVLLGMFIDFGMPNGHEI